MRDYRRHDPIYREVNRDVDSTARQTANFLVNNTPSPRVFGEAVSTAPNFTKAFLMPAILGPVLLLISSFYRGFLEFTDAWLFDFIWFVVFAFIHCSFAALMFAFPIDQFSEEDRIISGSNGVLHSSNAALYMQINAIITGILSFHLFEARVITDFSWQCLTVVGIYTVLQLVASRLKNVAKVNNVVHFSCKVLFIWFLISVFSYTTDVYVNDGRFDGSCDVFLAGNYYEPCDILYKPLDFIERYFDTGRF